MRLYDMPLSANCRRVRIFMAEKGVRTATENCWDDVRVALTEEYLARYRFRVVPMLELDDGRQIGESTAICRYFEALFPEPNLFGRNAIEIASVEMWLQRINFDGEIAAEEILRNSSPHLVDRGLAGSDAPVPQIPALVDRGKGRMHRLLRRLNEQLASTRYVAGEQFSMADISLLCALEFGQFVGLDVPTGYPDVMRWYAEVKARPSAAN